MEKALKIFVGLLVLSFIPPIVMFTGRFVIWLRAKVTMLIVNITTLLTAAYLRQQLVEVESRLYGNPFGYMEQRIIIPL